MDEHATPNIIPTQTELPPVIPVPPKAEKPSVPTGKNEFILAAVTVLAGILMCNFVIFGGFHVGYAVTASVLILGSAAYLRASGHRFDWYSGSLLVLCLTIAAGFGRSGDDNIKVFMLLFLTVGLNMSLCLAAKQNRRDPGSLLSLLDAPRALFTLGYGGMPGSARGILRGVRESGETGRKTGAVLIGLVICVPVLIVMVPLLMDADAAFEGVMKLLPELDPAEIILSSVCGFFFGWVFYSRGVRLNHSERPGAAAFSIRGVHALTVSTILSAVCLLYVVYLVSQLAYFVGGFSGILPEEFTVAEYARRGFFEMARLCGINLLLICVSVALVRSTGKTPPYIRLCCLFLGLITIFLVATASAKMFLYIQSFGLTQLRVLTEVIMLWLALTTLTVCIWLFLPKLPYMKVVVLAAMVMGAAVFWVDLDTVVAKYNVESYQSGRLETVDMEHLGILGPSAIPYIAELTEDPDLEIRHQAKAILRRARYSVEDFRDWNWEKARAARILEDFNEAEKQEVNALIREYLQMEVPVGTLQSWNCQPEMRNGQQFFSLWISEEEHEAFAKALVAAVWKRLPMTMALERAVCGRDSLKSLFTDLEHRLSLPTVGYYTFFNQYPGVEDPTNSGLLFNQDYQCFWLVWYDTESQVLSFFRIDQSMMDAS